MAEAASLSWAARGVSRGGGDRGVRASAFSLPPSLFCFRFYGKLAKIATRENRSEMQRIKKINGKRKRMRQTEKKTERQKEMLCAGRKKNS